MRKFCPKPFENFEVYKDGDAHVCCPGWLPRPIGNVMKEGGTRALWNNLFARDTRLSILDGSFRRCTSCPYLESVTGPVRWIDDNTDLSMFQIDMPRGPTFVNLAVDLSCNLACPSCRTEMYRSSQGSRDRVREIQKTVLEDGVLDDLEWLSVNGSGDPFASAAHLELLRSLTPDRYPRLKIKLHTNGLLLNATSWEALGAARTMVRSIDVSVDAATPETYAVNRGGDWTVLMRNLAFISELRTCGQVTEFQLLYVVQSNNWREAFKFVALARSVAVDRVLFSPLRNWGTFSEDEFMVRAAHRLGHPDRPALRAQFQQLQKDPLVLAAGLT